MPKLVKNRPACVSCGKQSRQRWKDQPVCRTCWQRCWAGGSILGPHVRRDERIAARRVKVKALLMKKLSATQIAARLKVERRTVLEDVKALSA